MGWAQSITDLTLKVAGSTVGDSSGTANKTILSATFGAGRPDWFASLSPGSASFTLNGDLTGSIDPGDSLELLRGTDELWTGKVDSVVLNEAPGQPDTTTVTGADFVAQLGEARLKGYTIALAAFHAQIDDALTEAGFSPTVVRGPSIGETDLAAWTSYTGTVLDFMNDGERYANCVTAVHPDGEIWVLARDRYPDFGERIYEPNAGLPLQPGLPTPSSLWRMDEASGTLADVVSSIGAAASGSPTYGQDGPWGATGPDAIAFQASDAADLFNAGNNYPLRSAVTTTWTIAGWIRWTGSTQRTIMNKLSSGPTDGYHVKVLSTGALRFRSYSGGSASATVDSAAGVITANTWHHIAIVRNGSDLHLYVDAELVQTGTAGTMPSTTVGLRFGADVGPSDWWDGRLCMFAIWTSDALTQAQLDTLIYLDYVTLPTPMTWVTSRSIANVINHWLIDGVTYSDATSISTYGRRTWDVDTTKAIPDTYSSELRTIMKDPRPIVTATYSVTSTSSPLITLAPLSIALYDGSFYQVLDVRHDIGPSEWRVTLILDRTQNDMTDGSPLLPA